MQEREKGLLHLDPQSSWPGLIPCFLKSEQKQPLYHFRFCQRSWRVTERNSIIKWNVTRQILIIFIIIYNGNICANALCGKGAFDDGLENKPLAVPKLRRSPLLKFLVRCLWKQIIKATALPPIGCLWCSIRWQNPVSLFPLVPLIIGWHPLHCPNTH